MAVCMLTTTNNPYDPLTQYDLWYNFDINNVINIKQDGVEERYKIKDCCSLLARVARTSDALSDSENEEEIERAIDEIIKFDVLNVYKKVVDKSSKT